MMGIISDDKPGDAGTDGVQERFRGAQERVGGAKREQCERCKEWERRGLSRYCPSCDQAHLAQLETIYAARRIKARSES